MSSIKHPFDDTAFEPPKIYMSDVRNDPQGRYFYYASILSITSIGESELLDDVLYNALDTMSEVNHKSCRGKTIFIALGNLLRSPPDAVLYNTLTPPNRRLAPRFAHRSCCHNHDGHSFLEGPRPSFPPSLHP